MSTWEWPKKRRNQIEYVLSLRPTEEQIRQQRRLLFKVVHVCHHDVVVDHHQVDVSRVTTSGSVGKGTCTRDTSDLDLIVYCKDFHGVANEDFGDHVPRILQAIQQAMDTRYPGTRDETFFQRFGLRYKIESMEIDILLGKEGVIPRDFLSISDPLPRKFLSTSVSSSGRAYMKRQPNLFKDLVRVVKDWRDSYSWPKGSKPKSYLLELLMLHACRNFSVLWNKKQESVRFQTSRQFGWLSKKILIRFFENIGQVPSYHPRTTVHDGDNLPLLKVWFERFYSFDDLPLEANGPLWQDVKTVKVSKNNGTKKINIKATALVVDPVNPTNNVWLTLGDQSNILVERAKETADRLQQH